MAKGGGNTGGLVLAILAVLALVLGGIYLSGQARDTRLDRGPLGLSALAGWLAQNGQSARNAHPRLTPLSEDLSLRVMPLYDPFPDRYDPDPDSRENWLEAWSLRNITSEILREKIARMPTLILLPKWRGAVVELGVAHEQSLLPLGLLNDMWNNGLPTPPLRLLRGPARFTRAPAPGGEITLFHAQSFDPDSLGKACRPELQSGDLLLVVSCRIKKQPHPVYLAADPDLMNNHGLALGGNAGAAPALLGRLRGDDPRDLYIDMSPDLTTRTAETDERQDYTRGGDEMARLLSPPFPLMGGAALAVLALLVWRGARRFGPALGPDGQAETGGGDDLSLHRDRARQVTVGAKARLLRLSAGGDAALAADYARASLQDLAEARGAGNSARLLTRLAARDPDLAGALQDSLARLTSQKAALPGELTRFHSLLTKLREPHESV